MKFTADDIRAFLEDEVVPYNSNVTVLGLLLLLALGLGVSISNPLQVLAVIIITFFFLLYLVSMFIYDKKKTLLTQRVFQSALAICFSLMLLFASFIFAMGQYQNGNIWILLLFGIMYLVNIVIACIRVLRNISNGLYSKNKIVKRTNKTNLVLSFIGFALLLPIIRMLMVATDLDLLLNIIAIVALLVSLQLLYLGCKNVLRVIFQIKYRISDESLEAYFDRQKRS